MLGYPSRKQPVTALACALLSAWPSGHSKASPATWLDQVYELALRVAVALDVALRRGQAGMAGKLLYVPQAAARLYDLVRRLGDEGPPPRVRGTAFKA